MTAAAGIRHTTYIAEKPFGYWKRAGATLTVAAAIAAAPGLTPLPDIAAEAPRLVLTSASPAAAQPVSPSPNGVPESLLHYGADFSLWAGRFLPIPGAILFHTQVAQATIVDPMSASIMRSLDAFTQGHLPLETALANIRNDFGGSIENFVKGELSGHSGVVPPASTPGTDVEPWIQWAIHTAISPLYYLPLPNALTIDQLSFAGVLAGTMIGSLVDNLGSVANGGTSFDVAMERTLNTFGQSALPEFIQSEQGLFTPPAPPMGVEQAINGLTAQEKDWSQVHGPIDFLSQLGIHSLGVVLQEAHDPVPILRQVITNDVSDLESLAAGTDPVAITAARIDRARAALGVIVHMTAIIGSTLANMPKTIGTQASTSDQAFNAALRTGDLGRVVTAAAQGVVDVGTSALAGLHTVGNEVESTRNGIADALGNPISDKRSHETDSAPIVAPRAIRAGGEASHPDAAKQGDKLGQSDGAGSASAHEPAVPPGTSGDQDAKKSDATRGVAHEGAPTSDGRDTGGATPEHSKDRPLHHHGVEPDDAGRGAGPSAGPQVGRPAAVKATGHHREAAGTKPSGGESHSTGARHKGAA
jgi:hypothetical protein